MKKLVSPMLYAAFFLPVFSVVMFVVITALPGMPDTVFKQVLGLIIMIFIMSTPLFWLANQLMMKLETLRKPNSGDHFRQSSMYYLAALYLSVSLARSGFHGGLGEVYTIIMLTISVSAIIVNAVLLLQRYRTKIN